MSVSRAQFGQTINELLRVDKFKDYGPNGLQVEGGETIQNLVTGVTACQALIDKAVALNADAILVHHGFFWKNEPSLVVGMKRRRLKALLANDINLFGYHLPLDAHPKLGNNAQLAEVLGIDNARICPEVAQDLLWQGELAQPLTIEQLSAIVADKLQRQPLVLKGGEHKVSKVAWCTGGAQDYIEQAALLGVDAFISGEASERTFHSAQEQGIHYLGAGHHATERYGIQALGQFLSQEFDLNWHHIDIDNPV
ncbi:Nif3-like dinuclear metal center hexameric protein [Paraferrimonas haliotis]|uniref:GTP cyclohydrolase 1 type 2 homolog n=1 Tax=Paraferrimonas haliotis TaxID=2013866 RepID=A0AA37WYL1_9GAMM|nr:Nif3-like dinuclear metal center hexameric protein [Paraferrimonas haliotis]GLS84529.1 GTP cyclohydrolase 1 type 2 [Paraferrimonas haliotis]